MRREANGRWQRVGDKLTVYAGLGEGGERRAGVNFICIIG